MKRVFIIGWLIGWVIFLALMSGRFSWAEWYPGFIHPGHTLYSDGERTSEQLKQKAVASGATFLISSDHIEQISNPRKATGLITGYCGFDNYLADFADGPVIPATGKKLVVVSGVEMAIRTRTTSHLLVFGSNLRPFLTAFSLTRPEILLKNLSQYNCIGIAAHPSQTNQVKIRKRVLRGLSGNFYFDRTSAPYIYGLEHFNETTHESQNTLRWYLDILSRWQLVLATAGCDSHTAADPSDFRRWTKLTWVWVDGELTYKKLLEAIFAGRTYSSEAGAIFGDFNYNPGFKAQTVDRPEFSFTTNFTGNLAWKKAKIYLDGQFLGFSFGERTSNNHRRYRFFDNNVGLGKHIYMVELEGFLVSSPIVLDVKKDYLPRVGYGWDFPDLNNNCPEDVVQNFIQARLDKKIGDLQLFYADSGSFPNIWPENFLSLSQKTKLASDSYTYAQKYNAWAFVSGKVYQSDSATRCDVHLEESWALSGVTVESTYLMILEDGVWKIMNIASGYVNW